MKSLSPLLMLAGITCLLSACNQINEVKNAESITSTPLNTTNKARFATLPRSINWGVMNPAPNPQEFVALEKSFVKDQIFTPAVADVNALKSLNFPWRETEPKVKASLAHRSDDVFNSYYRQKYALEMLCTTDLMSDGSDDALPVIAYYTNILDEEQNPSFAVMHQALIRLNKYWSAKQLNRVATNLIKRAESGIALSKEQRLKLPLLKEVKADFLKGEQENYKFIGLIKQTMTND